MENFKKDYQRFDEPPFSSGRIACGINALIEVLDLSVEKLPKNDIGTSLIALRLYELSTENRRQVMNIGGQSLQLQEIVKSRCAEESTILEVMKRTEQKYEHFKKTRDLI